MTTFNTSTHIFLSPAATARLRGQHLDDRIKNYRGEQTEFAVDIVKDDGTLSVDAATLLPNGWIRAYRTYEPSSLESTRADFLFAPGEVLALESSLTLNSQMSIRYNEDQERHWKDRESSWARAVQHANGDAPSGDTD